MHFKNWPQPHLPRFQKKVEQGLDKPALNRWALQFIQGSTESPLGLRVLLEGEMGSGKTTLAQSLLSALQVEEPIQGSPTFPIMTEYHQKKSQKRVIHCDLYRLRSVDEIMEIGLEEAFMDPEVIVIAEWASLFPEWVSQVVEAHAETLQFFRITLGWPASSDALETVYRDLGIEFLPTTKRL